MNFGVHLWDQYENLSQYTDKGIIFLEDIIKFLRGRIKIEIEYAKELKKLVKSHISTNKKKEDSYYTFTHATAFITYIKEISDVAGQHDQIAEELSKYEKDMNNSINTYKTERKRLFNRALKEQADLRNQIAKHDKARKLYEKSAKEEEKARERYIEMENDDLKTKAEVYNAKGIATSKQQICESYKTDYAAELKKTNDMQRTHYSIVMPDIYNHIQNMEEGRIEEVKNRLISFMEVEKKVVPILQRCIDGMEACCKTINAEKDIQTVIDLYRSGYTPNGDIEFVEYGTSTPNTTKKKNKLKAASFIRYRPHQNDKKDDPFFTNLPPLQQKKKINEKIVNFQKTLLKLNQERSGLEKMLEVAEKGVGVEGSSTPKSHMGLSQDRMNEELDKNRQNIENIQSEIEKYENFLRNIGHSKEETKSPNLNNHTPSSVKTTSLPPPPKEEITPTHSISNNDSDMFEEFEEDYSDSNHIEDCSLGRATAKYAFEGQNEGSLAIRDGEKLQIIEADTGDGWTRVKNDSGEDGFVPTLYIEYD
ncbi:DgyrCDS2842 [Dimorphilus gyrociliatus]|uniref:DgyrCDS2842 n=1 Tax=Dimorphilus gyrociliatus TaxID=2664684 RepID=A0A7I8VDD6_9ANNE|nr:DgyrCDS2842 [Dimorphilus gyrociliatus]